MGENQQITFREQFILRERSIQLSVGQHHCGEGRNIRGIINVRLRWGDHKRLYHKIDFRRNKKDIYDKIVTIERTYRNAYICVIYYGDGEKIYILHLRGATISAFFLLPKTSIYFEIGVIVGFIILKK